MPQRGRRPNGTGSVYPRKDGRWVAKITHERGEKPVIRYAKSEADAYALLDTLLAAREAGKLDNTPQQTLEQWLNTWLLTVAIPPRIRPHTQWVYTSRLKHVRDHLGKKRLAEVKPAHVASLQAELVRLQLKPGSVNDILRTFGSAMETAVRWELIPSNPVRKVDSLPAEDPTWQVLTLEQVQKLLQVSEGTRWRAMWAVMALAGLRFGEATALHWNDIRDGKIHVNHTVTYTPEDGLVLGPPKTRKSKRAVIMMPQVAEALEQHRTLTPRTSVLVFPAPQTGGFIWNSDARETLHRHLKRAGLPMRSPHQLRHTYGTLMVGEGVHLKVAASLMGHANTQQTERYSHPDEAMQHAATMRLSAALDKLGD